MSQRNEVKTTTNTNNAMDALKYIKKNSSKTVRLIEIKRTVIAVNVWARILTASAYHEIFELKIQN